MPNLVASFCLLGIELFYFLYHFLNNNDKTHAAVVKCNAPAKSSRAKGIVARYDAVLDQSESSHLYNHQSNDTYHVKVPDKKENQNKSHYILSPSDP